MNEHHKGRMSRRLAFLLTVFLTPVLFISAFMLWSTNAGASSHREAPAISRDQFADNTDTYVFIPEGQTDNIVLAANWIPFEGPEGGPNYYTFDDNVEYNIHVDIDGDAKAEVTYTLQSRTEPVMVDTFLYNTGPVTSLTDPDLTYKQFITLTETFEPGTQPMAANGNVPEAHIQTIIANAPAVPVNIGSKSTPDFAALESMGIHTWNDPRNGDVVTAYAGPIDDPFWVDLQVFDLLTLRGQAPPVGYTTGNNDPIDSVSGFNNHAVIIEVPVSHLIRDGESVIGVWATAKRVPGTLNQGPQVPTAHVQVSRLGMPLVNEVVLPIPLKDTFNAIQPEVDLTVYGLLQPFVEDPEVGNLLCGLYAVPLPGDIDDDCDTEFTPGTPRSGRGDIFDIFLQGMVLANEFTIQTAGGPATLPAGFNVNRPDGVVPAEMIRVNTAISGTLCSPTPSRLGILGGDACGFPNGRRLADDVVEIELLAVAGAAYEVLDDRDASFTFNADLIGVLDDGVNANDLAFRPTFPYMSMAQSGQEHLHDNPPAPPTSVNLSGINGSMTGLPWLEITIGSALLLGWLFWISRRDRNVAHQESQQ